MMRWYWLSFCDTTMDIPRDEQMPGGPSFLGACIVDVSPEDVEAGRASAALKRLEVGTYNGPVSDEDAGIVAAMLRAWELGCNPGGQVATTPYDGLPPGPERYWRRLLTKADIEEWDRLDEEAERA